MQIPAKVGQSTVQFNTHGILSITDVSEYLPYFLKKVWVLYKNETDLPFYISDNPVVLHNQNDFAPYGNLGLGMPGIEIYIPLSPKYCLSLLCPTLAEKFISAHSNILKFEEFHSEFVDKIIKEQHKDVKEFCQGMKAGDPVSVNIDNVKMMNSLQVLFSSRQIYCNKKEFTLVKEMISNDQRYRKGFELTIS